MLNPCLCKFFDKEMAYEACVRSVFPKLRELFPKTKLWLLIGFSLGGKYLLKARKWFLSNEKVKIALIDSICHSESAIRQVGDAPCRHWVCHVDAHQGLDTVFCGSTEHRMAVGACFESLTKWMDEDSESKCTLS